MKILVGENKMGLMDKLKENKIPIAKGVLVGTAVAVGGITLDATAFNTSLYDIAVNSANRSVGWDVLGFLAGTYETVRNYVAKKGK